MLTPTLNLDGTITLTDSHEQPVLTSTKPLNFPETRRIALCELYGTNTIAEAKDILTNLGLGWTDLRMRMPKPCEAKGGVTTLLNKLAKGKTLGIAIIILLGL